MRTFICTCGEKIFFDDSCCNNCGSQVGHCPVCRNVVALIGNEQQGYRCGNPACGTPLLKCHNYLVHGVCNRCVVYPTEGLPPPQPLCDCCRYNQVIPDLTIPGNQEKWGRLEAAKRRLFFQLDLLGLPRGTAADGFDPPLSFDFKADDYGIWGTTNYQGVTEQVLTGHLNGKITINIREADSVEREKLRVQFGEKNRTLIGHFRHEIAHYYWDLLIKGQREPACKQVFGDHDMSYAAALESHYQSGPPEQWEERFASAYASVHPWEDFAETFAFYLEIVSTLDTAHHTRLGGPGVTGDLDEMLTAYRELGDALNIMNRSMGLLDHASRPISATITEKLRFVHDLIQSARQAAAYSQ